MTTLFSSLQTVSGTWLSRAAEFSQQLPQAQGVRKEGRNIILTYVVDAHKPADQVGYAEEHLDARAVEAYQSIFSDSDEADLLMNDIRLTFAILFWNGQELQDVEFTYHMNDLQFLKTYIAERRSSC